MQVCCDLQVDANGEETFMVDKRTLSLYSGRIRNLFGKSEVVSRHVKVVFHDFPGGADGFELMSRFCYSNGTIEIAPSNLLLLHTVAQFMEMNKSASGTSNLLEQTEKQLEEISCWTWSDLMIALKQCHNWGLYPHSPSIKKCIDTLVGKLILASAASPCPSASSSDSSGFGFSCATKSVVSMIKTNSVRTIWWFEELLVLHSPLIETVVNSMMSGKFDHGTISKFLLYYSKSKIYSASSDEKCRMGEMVINVHYSLDQESVACKSLFEILRVTLGLNISKCSRNKLENMIGMHLNQATLDNLLVPSPFGMNYLYDVNLVLRLLKAFLQKGPSSLNPLQLKRVASLIDSYLVEIAPDPCLKSSKFLALVTALPDCARDSHDELYHAINMYLEVHAGMSDEEKLKLLCVVKIEKLSAESSLHFYKNFKLLSKPSVVALHSKQLKVRNILHETDNSSSLIDSPCSFIDRGKKEIMGEETLLYTSAVEVSADDLKVRARLQGMQWRVMELEKFCNKMQTQMAKMMKSKSRSRNPSRSLPKLCS